MTRDVNNLSTMACVFPTPAGAITEKFSVTPVINIGAFSGRPVPFARWISFDFFNHMKSGMTQSPLLGQNFRIDRESCERIGVLKPKL